MSYDPADDFAKSIDFAYEAVRLRVAAGGAPWVPELRRGCFSPAAALLGAGVQPSHLGASALFSGGRDE